ncbi:hypothetical protein BG418_20645 [Streptomyces sp. CBMA152]|nr:hypothetical protein [Streptomyces sp. CBMA152]
MLVTDAVYDRRAKQVSLAVLVHYEDGGSSEAALILTPSDMEQLHARTGRILADHEWLPGRAP